MTAAAPRLAGFAVALAVLFGIGALAGRVFDPAPPNASPQRPAADRQAMAGMAQTDQHGAGGSAMKMGVRGLAVSAEGLRMVVDTPVFEPGRTRELRFRVLDDRGRALRDYDVQHTKRMHLIVVCRDLSGFQHLHPRLAADGTWRVPLRLDAAGSYRVFADFSHDDMPVTLGSDLTIDGRFSARQLPAPKARELIEAGAKRSLADLKAVQPYDPGSPCEIVVDFNTSDQVEKYRYRPGVEITESRQIASRADDWWTAWRQFFF
jgi:hypothetical protein